MRDPVIRPTTSYDGARTAGGFRTLEHPIPVLRDLGPPGTVPRDLVDGSERAPGAL